MLDPVAKKPCKKGQFKSLHSDWLMARYCALTPTSKVKNPAATLCCHQIKAAQDEINPEFTVEFKKCCISNSVDRAQDDLFESEEVEKTKTLKLRKNDNDGNDEEV